MKKIAPCFVYYFTTRFIARVNDSGQVLIIEVASSFGDNTMKQFYYKVKYFF
jgi:hypothetical protein